MKNNTNYIAKLAIGTVQFGFKYGISNTSGKTNSEEAKKILNTAEKSGIITLDTARDYDDSESVIGVNHPERFQIISKFPNKVLNELDLRISLDETLLNLQVSALYGYLAHHSGTLIKTPELWEKLIQLKKEGKVEKIGYSLYNPIELDELVKIGCIPEIVQIPYNFLDRRFEKHFEYLKSVGCEIHVRSVFLQGVFFLDPKELPKFFTPIQSLLEELRMTFKSASEIAGFLLDFVVKNESVDKLVFGINNEKQLVDNISSLMVNRTPVHLKWDKQLEEEILMPHKWPK